MKADTKKKHFFSVYMQTISKNLLPWKEFYENSHFSDLKKSVCVCMKGQKATFAKRKKKYPHTSSHQLRTPTESYHLQKPQQLF